MSLNDIALVGRATFCSILKLSCDLICGYTVLYFLPKRSLLLPTNDEITGLVGSQNGANIYTSVPISLSPLPTNVYLYTSSFVVVWKRPFRYHTVSFFLHAPAGK